LLKIVATSFPPLILNNEALKYVTEFKYLGHIIRNNLSHEDISREIRNLFVLTNLTCFLVVLVHVHLMLKLPFLEVSVFVFMVLRYGGSIAIHCIIGSSHATTNAQNWFLVTISIPV